MGSSLPGAGAVHHIKSCRDRIGPTAQQSHRDARSLAAARGCIGHALRLFSFPGKRKLPISGRQKLCAILACRGECAWTKLPPSHLFANGTRFIATVLRARSFEGGGLTQTGAIAIAIDKMAVATAPADFEFARTGQRRAERWVMVADATAAGGRAIEQVSTEPTDNRFPLAIYGPLSAKNVEVSLRFKPVAGKVDQAGGIAVRLTSPDNYYVVRANALEDNVNFYRVIKASGQSSKAQTPKFRERMAYACA